VKSLFDHKPTEEQKSKFTYAPVDTDL
jgi:hypothetical protein